MFHTNLGKKNSPKQKKKQTEKYLFITYVLNPQNIYILCKKELPEARTLTSIFLFSLVFRPNLACYNRANAKSEKKTT